MSTRKTLCDLCVCEEEREHPDLHIGGGPLSFSYMHVWPARASIVSSSVQIRHVS
jgi:hypothetical protein